MATSAKIGSLPPHLILIPFNIEESFISASATSLREIISILSFTSNRFFRNARTAAAVDCTAYALRSSKLYFLFGCMMCLKKHTLLKFVEFVEA